MIVSGSAAALAPQLPGVIYESRGRHELRNVSEPVELFAVIRTGEEGSARMASDPVCRMVVNPAQAAGRLSYEGTDYFFCSLTCAGAFASRPERFV